MNKLVMGERMKDYGSPTLNWTHISEVWSSFLGVEISPKDAVLMMVLMKAVREKNKHKEDNIVDIKGYADIADMIENQVKRRE